MMTPGCGCLSQTTCVASYAPLEDVTFVYMNTIKVHNYYILGDATEVTMGGDPGDSSKCAKHTITVPMYFGLPKSVNK